MKIGKWHISKDTERTKELEVANEKMKRKLEKAETENAVYKEERSEASEVLRMKLGIEADRLENEARASYLDKREEYLGKLAQAMKWDKAMPNLLEPPRALPERQYYYPYN